MASFTQTPRQPAARYVPLNRAIMLTAQTGIWLLMAATVYPQTPPATQTPRFEVASIRPVPDDRSSRVYYRSPPGSAEFVVRNENLTRLVSWAYDFIDLRQLTKAPDWFDTAKWDIIAKPEGTVPPSEATTKLLVQQLLRDRFNFRYHTRTEVVKGYLLTTAKGGPKLTTSNGGEPNVSALLSGPNARLRVWNSPVSGLASALINVLHEPVLDGTGLTGNYDVSFRFAPLDDTESTAPSIFSAVGELGLKLEKSSVPLQVLVVDHIDRFPSEN